MSAALPQRRLCKHTLWTTMHIHGLQICSLQYCLSNIVCIAPSFTNSIFTKTLLHCANPQWNWNTMKLEQEPWLKITFLQVECATSLPRTAQCLVNFTFKGLFGQRHCFLLHIYLFNSTPQFRLRVDFKTILKLGRWIDGRYTDRQTP